MEIKFYDYQGKHDVINKILNEPLAILNGELRSQFNRRNGVIDVKVSGFNSLVLRSNYCYITELDRYYFINDLTLLSLNILRLDLLCDLLMSFKNYLKDEELMIERQSNNYNPLLKDDSIPLKSIKQVSEIVPPKGTLATASFNNYIGEDDHSIVVNIMRRYGITNTMGSESADNNVLTPPNTISSTSNKSRLLQLSSTWSYPKVIKNSDMPTLSQEIFDHSDYASFIKSITIFPLNLTPDPEDSTTLTTLDIKSDVRIAVENFNYYHEYYTIADFTIDGTGTFLDYSPYSQYEVFIPYYGWVELDPNNVVGKRILVEYMLNPEDGSATVFIVDRTSDKLLFQSSCQLGVRLGMTTSNQADNDRNRMSSIINLSLGGIASGINIAGGVAMGNPFGVAKGIAGIASSFGTFANSMIHNIHRASGQVSSGFVGLYSPKEVRLRITKNTLIDDIYEFTQNEGRLSLKKLKISSLIGFSKCSSDIHLNAYPSATLQEMTLIKNQLIEGFYWNDN